MDLIEIAEKHFPETIKLDNLDEAIIGLKAEKEGRSRLIYSKSKIIKILMKRDGMNYNTALDFFCYNIDRLGKNENMPSIMLDLDGEEPYFELELKEQDHE